MTIAHSKRVTFPVRGDGIAGPAGAPSGSIPFAMIEEHKATCLTLTRLSPERCAQCGGLRWNAVLSILLDQSGFPGDYGPLKTPWMAREQVLKMVEEWQQVDKDKRSSIELANMETGLPPNTDMDAAMKHPDWKDHVEAAHIRNTDRPETKTVGVILWICENCGNHNAGISTACLRCGFHIPS